MWNNVCIRSVFQRIFGVFFLIFFFGVLLNNGGGFRFQSTVNAFNFVKNPTGFVDDAAGILTSNEKNKLESKLRDFESVSSNEIVVVIVPSLEGETIERFAVKLFEQWGIGKEKNDNGVLLFISSGDREIRIEVGYGLEGALTDLQSSWIIRNILVPEFREERYFNGISKAVDSIMAATKGEYVPSDSTAQGNFQYGSSGAASSNDAIFSFVFIGFLWLSSIFARSKSWWAGGVVGGVIAIVVGFLKGFLYLGLIAIFFLVPLGLLFDFIVSRQYLKGKERGHIPWWIGGGRFGGGGGFGGGGFGGFGGGGSGGGGASGRW